MRTTAHIKWGTQAFIVPASLINSACNIWMRNIRAHAEYTHGDKLAYTSEMPAYLQIMYGLIQPCKVAKAQEKSQISAIEYPYPDTPTCQQVLYLVYVSACRWAELGFSSCQHVFVA